MLLMCKDVPVYDIQANRMLNSQLSPRQFSSSDDFEDWKLKRGFVESNKAAEYVVTQLPETDRGLLRRMSLSDCYWIKSKSDKIKFADVTPYTNSFTRMGMVYRDSSVPDQNLGGSVLKNWEVDADGARIMIKEMRQEWVQNEVECVSLATSLGLDCARVKQRDDTHLIVYNMTSVNRMLLTFKEMGIKCNGVSPSSVSEAYKKAGCDVAYVAALQTILFDAVVGNFDREKNMGNWAVFKNPDTGNCVPSDLFDFNLAHRLTPNYYLKSISDAIKGSEADDMPIRILSRWEAKVSVPIWRENLRELKKLL